MALYEVYRKTSKNPDSFDQFLNYSNQILSDFNTIDRYLLETKHLIFDLKSITDIDTWSLNSTGLTENQQKFTQYFELLGEIYNSFQIELNNKKIATNGMAYKSVASNCKSLFNLSNNIYFVGLNALSKAEEKIIDFLIQSNRAKVIFDGDEFYTKNKNHEAGLFYRKYGFNLNSEVSNRISSLNKSFNFYEARTNQEQTSFVNAILDKEPLKNNTVVYLMDENMAGPLQNALNNIKHPINFTMGLPINKSEVFTLFSLILDSIKFKNKEKHFNNGSIHFEWINKIISLKTLKKKIGINFISSKEWKETIEKNNLYLNKNWIKKHLLSIDDVFNLETLIKTKDGITLLKNLKNYLKKIQPLFNSNELELFIIKQYSELILKLSLLINDVKFEVSSHVIIKTLIQESKKFKLPTSGDPYSGIQVMGFLESRMLDFENVIYLSCNESFLPKADTNQSFFPNDLKKHYGLPGVYEKDALYSYYFYRSLQYVKNAHFIYVQSKSSGLDSSEKSRFINQINLELKPLGNITFRNHTIKPWSDTNKFSSKVDEKLNNTLIERWISSGISPSSINCFSTCSLNFYNKYLLRIREEKFIENRISPAKWGDTVHLVLEKLFYKDLLVNKTSLNKMQKEYKNLMRNTFDKYYTDKRYLKGQNGLVYRQFEQCIKRLIQNEIHEVNKNGEFQILHTEKPLLHSFNVPFNGKNITAKLKGKADRIDQTSSGLRILDYKTGYLDSKHVKIENYDSLFENEKALQLVFYAYLYMKEFTETDAISSGIISIKNPKSNKLMFTQNKDNLISRDITTIFESKLIDLIGSMNNSQFTFEHNSKSKYCMMC